jgi:predicted Zn-dependent peptidase
MSELAEIRVPGDRHPAPFHRAVLDNGLTVLIKPTTALPIVAVDIWVGVGAAHEEEGLEGASHFLEHMFFKGTERHPVGEMDAIVKEMGGYNNAATSLENTHYFIVAPSRHFGRALGLLADHVQDLALPSAELNREREVVKEEINRKEDSPGGKLYSLLSETALAGTPYGHSVLGTRESLDRIGRAEMRSHWLRHYNAGNTILAVAGDVDPAAVLRAASEVFSGYSSGERSPIGPFARPVPRAERIVVGKDVQQTYMALAAPTPGREDDESYYALELASLVLGEGPTSLLSRRLERELNLVTGISAWSYDLPGTGLLGVDAVCDPQSADRVMDEIERVLDHAVAGAITPSAVERAKRILNSDFAFDNETAASITGTLAEFELLFGAAETFVDYLEGVRAVKAEDCVRVLREHFDADRRLTVVIEPNGNGSK